MFRGLTALNIDEKGRIIIPAHYRKTIMDDGGGRLILTIDTEDCCLLLYTYPIWQEIEQKLGQLPSFQPLYRRIQRLLIGHATETDIDRHGRILLPPLLRHYAGLEKTVMLVGQGKKIEIWSETQWHLSRDAWLAENLDENSSLPPELLSLTL